MREHKYQAWDTHNKKMLPVLKIDLEDMSICYVAGDYPDDERWLFNGFELREYTGLHDRSGKEVYEGDIVECVDIGIQAGAVTWLDPGLFYAVVAGNAVHGMYNGWSIIGTIYANPELLETVHRQ